MGPLLLGTMWMQMRKWAVLAVALCCSAVLGCGDEGGFVIAVTNGSLKVVVVSDCPRCDDSASDHAFGRFTFLSNVTRDTARDILAVCGFTVVSGHGGSDGDPLQIASCGGGLELAFASNAFNAFALRSGFTGQFADGIRIGDSLQDVRAREPGLIQVDPLTFLRDDGMRRVEANFDANQRLRELIVGRGFVR